MSRPRIAFLGVPSSDHPIRSVCVAPGAYVVAVNTSIPGFDHAAGAEVMRLLIGDFEDVTIPGAFDRTGPTVASIQRDIRTLLADQLAAPGAPVPTVPVYQAAKQLVFSIVDTVDELAPSAGRETWPNADRRSDKAYHFVGILIGETLRRHVLGGRQDGVRPAVAARKLLPGLLAACHIYTAEYTQGPT